MSVVTVTHPPIREGTKALIFSGSRVPPPYRTRHRLILGATEVPFQPVANDEFDFCRNALFSPLLRFIFFKIPNLLLFVAENL